MAFSVGLCSGAVCALPMMQGVSMPQGGYSGLGQSCCIPAMLPSQPLVLQLPQPASLQLQVLQQQQQQWLLQQLQLQHLRQHQAVQLQTPSKRMPSDLELAAAVESLYLDGLRPYGRILRKRLLELTGTLGFAMLELDLKELKAVCEACPYLRIEEHEGAADWSALLPSRPDDFVDVYCTEDSYPEDMWASAERFFTSLPPGYALPGGRFACAQVLVRQRLPFLAGYSLGEVCHIVQLAISCRRLLGYSKGTLVPYQRSESRKKDLSALNQHPCTSRGGCRNTLVTWETICRCIRKLFAASPSRPPRIPLSNIKRVFRSEFQLELSETFLGYAKLSDLFQDPRLKDVCAASQCSFGYVIVPAASASSSGGGGGDAKAPRNSTTPAEALMDEDSASLPRRRAANVTQLSPDLIESVAATPSASSPALQRLASPLPTLLVSMRSPPPSLGPKSAADPLAAGAMTPRKRLAIRPASGSRLAPVRNTFIHYALPPPTPVADRCRARAQSLPRDPSSKS